MSKTNIVIGEKVSLIPFKHKGKIGEVKFIGEIDGKNTGNWVGIELEEPNGDCDGDFNDNVIFECKPGCGLFLRPTQVRSLTNDVSIFLIITYCRCLKSCAKMRVLLVAWIT